MKKKNIQNGNNASHFPDFPSCKRRAGDRGTLTGLTTAFLLLLTLLHGASAKTVVIYHTCDVHGWYFARPATWNRKNPQRIAGGFPALSALVKKEKNPYILLDSGDMAQGTPEGTVSRGMASVALMNRLGYSAAVPGNHDYDFGEENLKRLISSSTFSWLGANVCRKKDGGTVSYLKPYIIKEIAGEKIAILGLLAERVYYTTLPENVEHLEFRNEAKEAAKWVDEIKRQKPDAIVVLIHGGLSLEFSTKMVNPAGWKPGRADESKGALAVARAAEGIAAVFGGHLHTGLAPAYRDPESGTLIAESFWGLNGTSRVELEFDDKTGKFIGAGGGMVYLWTDETGEDPDVKAVLKPFQDSVRAEMDEVLGETEVDLSRDDGGTDSVIGNWVSDAMRKAMGTDLALMNTFGIRADMPRGKITMRDSYQVMPFDNTVVTADINGEQIVKIMKHYLRPNGTLLQISGAKVIYSVSADGRVKNVRVNINGRPVVPKTFYSVATNQYLTSSGPEGKLFADGKNLKDTGTLIRDMLINEVRTSSPVKMPKGERIIRE
ncbi:MAG: bifunctional UDP-sugar hydrolase/5'-nucleotidase [bacterium]